ncbi:siderophore-interacting protein [Streptomyces sp. SCA3-4]|uniref:siderophore-interacting protein n=1 Tax=Streptomyces sichuanensis TaxID=2871810 RepID=UPI001CE2A1E1|nr:siderophore-interacting protein [Streptomyces sichuanensis]MCA6096280.1 siderophore-interacting protein [Streptomyces sichuanensis]
MTDAPPPPYRWFDLYVLRTERISPALLRVTFGGDRLGEMVTGGRDQRFKLFLPRPGQDAPVLPDDRGVGWYAQWRTQDPAVRAVMRSYTVRELRHDPAELDVDFVQHGEHGEGTGHGGPASHWSRTARPGDRVTVLGPVAEENGGVDFQPPAGTDWVLVTADESALPAAAGILAWLPAGTPAKVWIEVSHPDDVQDLPTAADADITWLVRSTPADRPVLDAVRTAELPAGTPYAWIAGESGTIRALRRHLVGDRGIDRRAVTFTGYWRLGATEEDLLAELG